MVLTSADVDVARKGVRVALMVYAEASFTKAVELTDLAALTSCHF